MTPFVRAVSEETGTTRFTVRHIPYTAWASTEYSCLVSDPFDPTPGYAQWPLLIHLHLSRRDQGTVYNRLDMLAVMDELVGPAREAMQLYPAEERLLDVDNVAHLFVFADAKVHFPIGSVQSAASTGAFGEYRWSLSGKFVPHAGWPEFQVLTVTRPGTTPDSWPDLQAIKNQALGPTHEAVEVLSRPHHNLCQSAVVLFALADSWGNFPFGYFHGRITDATPESRAQFAAEHMRPI